ncbi:dihydrofolate reductase [Alicyclobacillus sp. SO9]|uniref:dihydrofolate reductase n=1 Tax=Alicyclobacillus sp. SO9 TaxID=2665646 RepID=UPI0018E7F052|nr:dihydrofolate reductase [Alicyclobacillus sp. SO9]QQE77228.1 dihydrofolate reductase [Alicyclobacillus sp. SO9]
MISILLAKSRNGVIGKNNGMPWHIPEDLRYFKKLTTGKNIVMGRRTYTAIGRALPHRINYVVTRDTSFTAQNVHVLHHIDAITRIPGDVVIIGGGSIIEQTIHLAQVLYITEIDAVIEGNTTVEIDLSDWVLTSSTPGNQDKRSPFEYSFNVYVRKPTNAVSN